MTKSIDFDIALAGDIRVYFDTHFDALDASHKVRIQSMLMGNQAFPNKSDLKYLGFVWEDKDLRQRAQAMYESNKRIQPALAVGAFIWALNQPWAKKINIPKLLSNWANGCIRPKNTEGNTEGQMRMGVLFLKQLLPRINDVPIKYRNHLLSETLDCMHQYATPWKNNNTEITVKIDYIHLQANAMLELEDAAERQEKWISNSQKVFRYSALREALEMASLLMKTNVPTFLYIEALKGASLEVWCCTEMLQRLIPVLDSRETHRIRQLPLLSPSGRQEIHCRRLLQMYCPAIYPMIEMGIDEQDWKYPERIVNAVTAWGEPQHGITLSVPNDVLEMP